MSPRRRTTDDSGLSHAAIVTRALELADAEGIGGITIRRLAQDLGVTPMALYWHVANKDELLAAMGDRFFDGVELPPDGGDWADRLGSVTTALVTSLRRHPASAHLAAGRVLQCDSGRDLTEPTLALLRAQGFSVTEATDVARTALQTAIMLVVQEAGAEVAVAQDERCRVVEAKHQLLSSLPRDRYPNLVDCADALTDTEDEETYYRFGVQLFVAGVRGLHAALHAEPAGAESSA